MGAVLDLFAAPQHAYTRRLMASKPERNVLENLAGTELALQARGVAVAYPVPLPGLRGWFSHGEFLAVSQVDLDLPCGQTLGVVGESGSGKSTLALAALGLLKFKGAMSLLGQS